MLIDEGRAAAADAELPAEIRQRARTLQAEVAEWSAPLMPQAAGEPDDHHRAALLANAASFLAVEMADACGAVFPPEAEEKTRAFFQASAISQTVGQFLAASCADTMAAVNLLHAIANQSLHVCQTVQEAMHGPLESPQGHEGGNA